MQTDHTLRDIFTSPALIPIIFAVILAGCSADIKPLTGSASAVTSADVSADASPSVTLTATPTATPIPEQAAADDLDVALGEAESTIAKTSGSTVTFAADDETGEAGAAPAGIRIYRENYCGTCHALAVAQTTGAFGPPHNQIGLVAETQVRDANYTGNATTAAEYIRESLLDPTAYLVPGYEVTYMKMPPFTHLKEEDIDTLVTFLLDQR